MKCLNVLQMWLLVGSGTFSVSPPRLFIASWMAPRNRTWDGEAKELLGRWLIGMDCEQFIQQTTKPGQHNHFLESVALHRELMQELIELSLSVPECLVSCSVFCIVSGYLWRRQTDKGSRHRVVLCYLFALLFLKPRTITILILAPHHVHLGIDETWWLWMKRRSSLGGHRHDDHNPEDKTLEKKKIVVKFHVYRVAVEVKSNRSMHLSILMGLLWSFCNSSTNCLLGSFLVHSVWFDDNSL